MIDDKQQKVLQLTKEMDDQAVKLERVQKQNSKHAREVRKSSKEELPEEVSRRPARMTVHEQQNEATAYHGLCRRLQRDMNVRELRELNKNAMRVFGDVIHQYPDVSQAVQLYFNQAGLPPPPAPGSATSSRMTSRASSARSSLASSRSSNSGGSGYKPKPVTIGECARSSTELDNGQIFLCGRR